MNYIRAFYYLSGLLRSAYWSRDRLIEYQNKKLRHIIKYAYDNVLFYHESLRRIGIRPDDVRCAEDLTKLPVIRRNEISKDPAAFVSKDFEITSLKRLSTSGSTGRPLFLYISQAEDEFRKAKHLRANISGGQRLRDKWIVITSPTHFGSSTKLQRALGVYTPTPISVFDEVDKQALTIEKLDPDILDGYSSSLYLLAKEVQRRQMTAIKPRFVIGGAELIDDTSRRFVENTFDAPFIDHYLCAELDSISWQCKEKDGYHIDAESIIVETVNDQERAAAGESGEIVCTSLFNYAMPLIRYAVGDVGVLSVDGCACGRMLPTMKMIEGRCDSLLMMPDGKVFSPRTFTVALSRFRYYDLFDQFRIIQKRADFFEIYIKMKKSAFDEAKIAGELASYLMSILDLKKDSVKFEVKFVESIPVDKTGKLRMVLSELSKEASVAAESN